ncbi:MAG: nucleotidyltransferase domain-containing protein [Methanotrichaceae archaeon]
MDRVPNERVKEALHSFKNIIETRFHIDRMILFGSRARDDWLYSSDIDLILVSDDFRSMSFMERIGEISQLWDCDLTLEAICYTPEEFERKKAEIGIVEDAVKYGIDI